MERNEYIRSEFELDTPAPETSCDIILPGNLSQALGKTNFSTRRAMVNTVREASVAAVHEQCRALLARGALTNVVALSELSAKLSFASPQAAPRCQAIVNSYTAAACQRIISW